MMNPNIETAPERARVSIAERLIPSLSFAVAAATGAVGAWQTRMFFDALRHAETAGFDAFFVGVSRIFLSGGILLSLAAGLGLIGIIVSTVRMFGNRATASPPGLLLLVAGGFSLISPVIVGCGMLMTVSAMTSPARGGIAMAADTVLTMTIGAMIASALSLMTLLALSFIPFSSRRGRKLLPLISLVVVEIATGALAAGFFWAAIQAMGLTKAGVLP
jgi:hypothetical protein